MKNPITKAFKGKVKREKGKVKNPIAKVFKGKVKNLIAKAFKGKVKSEKSYSQGF